MQLTNEILITFDSHFDAALFAKALRQNGIACYTMPIPRALSASCGVCVVADDGDYEAVKELAHRDVYKVVDGEYQPLK